MKNNLKETYASDSIALCVPRNLIIWCYVGPTYDLKRINKYKASFPLRSCLKRFS
jgi:hypothetical protein